MLQNIFHYTCIFIYTARCILCVVGNSPGDYKDIKDIKSGSDDIKVDEGTLSIHNIQKNHEGRYLCEAVNGIGSGLSAVITISVQGWLNI